VAAIEEVTRAASRISTPGGGTSDARFHHPLLSGDRVSGLVGQEPCTRIDERTPVTDLEKLTKIYRGVLDRYFCREPDGD